MAADGGCDLTRSLSSKFTALDERTESGPCLPTLCAQPIAQVGIDKPACLLNVTVPLDFNGDLYCRAASEFNHWRQQVVIRRFLSL